MICELIKFFDKYMPEEDKIPFGYERKSFYYALDIDRDGNLLDIVSLKQDDHGLELIVPSNGKPESNGAVPRFLWGSFKYFFTNARKYDKAAKKFKPFGDKFFLAEKEYLTGLLGGLDNDGAKAVLAFFDNAESYARAFTNDECLSYEYRFVFRYGGKFLTDDAELKKVWEESNIDRSLLCRSAFSGGTGQRRVEAQPQFNVPGCSSGSSLFARNVADAPSLETRFGMPEITEEDTFKYSSALNYLNGKMEMRKKTLKTIKKDKDGKTKTVEKVVEYPHYFYRTKLSDDLSVFHWAETTAKINYDDALGDVSDMQGDRLLKTCYEKGKEGEHFNAPDLDVPCHVYGLVGKKGRIQVLFSFTDTLSDMIRNAQAHLDRLRIVGLKYPPTIYQIMNLAMNEGEKTGQYNNLAQALVLSVTKGNKYPLTLFRAMLEHVMMGLVRGEDNGGLRICSPRFIQYMSVIKAILIRNYGKEGIQMGINIDEKDTAYLLGRLYAIAWLNVDKRHRKNMDKVKSRWFRAAQTTPALAYPEYIQSAILYGTSEYKIASILKDVGENYPTRLTHEQMGMWQMGFFQETARIFKIGEKEEADIPEDSDALANDNDAEDIDD